MGEWDLPWTRLTNAGTVYSRSLFHLHLINYRIFVLSSLRATVQHDPRQMLQRRREFAVPSCISKALYSALRLALGRGTQTSLLL